LARALALALEGKAGDGESCRRVAATHDWDAITDEAETFYQSQVSQRPTRSAGPRL